MPRRPQVLSTQSLLFAIGLGAGAIPLAAALNWARRIIAQPTGSFFGFLLAPKIAPRRCAGLFISPDLCFSVQMSPVSTPPTYVGAN